MFKRAFYAQLNKLTALPLNLCLADPDGNWTRFGNGDGPVVKLQVTDPRVYRKLLLNPSVGFAEAYAAGKICAEADDGVDAIYELCKALFTFDYERAFLWYHSYTALRTAWWKLFSGRNTVGRSRRNSEAHYDANSRLVEAVIGPTLAYSCAFFARPEMTLEQAQMAKFEYCLRKADVRPGMKLLDIGCGYGTLVILAAQRFGANCFGVTLSREQIATADRLICEASLRTHCAVGLMDYRELQNRYDRIISIGMYEHVGRRRWKELFKHVDALLKEGGVFLLHTICSPSPKTVDPFIRKHIFPGGDLPAIAEVCQAAEGTSLQLRDFENLQQHYHRTLKEWLSRLRQQREQLIEAVGQRRYRLFEVYLAGSAACFALPRGWLQLGQFLFTKGAAPWPPTREFMTDWLNKSKHLPGGFNTP